MARPQEFETSEVLRNAMRIFWSKGYEATSLNDILDATGLSKSSLYASFGDKRALFLATFNAYRKERLWHLHQILNDGQPARVSIENFFRQALARSLDENSAKGCMTVNEAIELAPHDGEIQQMVAEDFKAIEDAFARTIERGLSEGSITSQEAPHTLARFLVVGLQGLEVMARAKTDCAQLDETVTVMMTVLTSPPVSATEGSGAGAKTI